MTTVTIAHEVPENTVNSIQQLLNEIAIHDVNWNGAVFSIERGDFTCIEGDESAEAVKLLREIDSVIRGY